MAATALAGATSSSSLSFCNKVPHLLSDYCSPASIPITAYLTSKIKPIKSLKLRSHYLHTPQLFLHFGYSVRASSAFDSVDVAATEDEEPPESSSETEQGEEDEEDGQTATESAEAGRLYVGNLPYAMTSSELREIFAQAGSVASVEIVYDRVTDRSRGFAFVTMGSVEEAQEAIRMFDESQVGGRTVKVNFPEVPRGGLREAFGDQPGLLSAKVIYDRDSGRSRGGGRATFAIKHGRTKSSDNSTNTSRGFRKQF
ncbi:unnamed protein product [Thlaspi arvense]|uniref:RRM domain-containing protein n=1 Tax=Thlaspi arvense TaxID=13288 RepID=A0AAU9RF38_THLAR|nr:unnamed protein product [Thlaspi arvense]